MFAFLAGAAVVTVLVMAALAFAVFARVLLWLILLPFKLLFWLLAVPVLIVKAIALSVGGLLFGILAIVAVAVGAALMLVLALPLLPILILGFVAWAFLRLLKRPAAA